MKFYYIKEVVDYFSSCHPIISFLQKFSVRSLLFKEGAAPLDPPNYRVDYHFKNTRLHCSMVSLKLRLFSAKNRKLFHTMNGTSKQVSRSCTLVKYVFDGTKKSVDFEIAALFTRLHGEGRSAAISKLGEFLVPSSRFGIVRIKCSFSKFGKQRSQLFCVVYVQCTF